MPTFKNARIVQNHCCNTKQMLATGSILKPKIGSRSDKALIYGRKVEMQLLYRLFHFVTGERSITYSQTYERYLNHSI